MRSPLSGNWCPLFLGAYLGLCRGKPYRATMSWFDTLMLKRSPPPPPAAAVTPPPPQANAPFVLRPFVASKHGTIMKSGVMTMGTDLSRYARFDRFSRTGMEWSFYHTSMRAVADLMPEACIDEASVLRSVLKEISTPGGSTLKPGIAFPKQLYQDIQYALQTDAPLCNPITLLFRILQHDPFVDSLSSAKESNVCSACFDYTIWWSREKQRHLMATAQTSTCDAWYETAVNTMYARDQPAIDALVGMTSPALTPSTTDLALIPTPWLVLHVLDGIRPLNAMPLPMDVRQFLSSITTPDTGAYKIPVCGANALFLVHATHAILQGQPAALGDDTWACLRAVSGYGVGVNPTLLNETLRSTLNSATEHMLTSLRVPEWKAQSQRLMEDILQSASARLQKDLADSASRLLSVSNVAKLVGAAGASMVAELQLLHWLAPQKQNGLFVQQRLYPLVYRPIVVAMYPLLFMLTHMAINGAQRRIGSRSGTARPGQPQLPSISPSS